MGNRHDTNTLRLARARRCCTGDDALARQLVEHASLRGVALNVQHVRAALEDPGHTDALEDGGVDDPWDAVDAALDANRE
jgi:hypothetical protein